MEIIKSRDIDESFTPEELLNFSGTLSKLEKEIICEECSIRRKSFGICPSEMETVCEYSSWQ